MSKKIGYIRVSTIQQNTDRQLSDVDLDKIFSDKVSGKTRKRNGLTNCLEYLREDDVLYVHSIDRLARNLVDLQNIVSDLVDRGVTVKFIKENMCFNNTSDHFGKLMLQMLGSFAEFERSMIKERQAEGIKSAKQRGVKFGRKCSLTQDQADEIRYKIHFKNANKSALAREYGVSRQTVYNLARVE